MHAAQTAGEPLNFFDISNEPGKRPINSFMASIPFLLAVLVCFAFPDYILATPISWFVAFERIYVEKDCGEWKRASKRKKVLI